MASSKPETKEILKKISPSQTEKQKLRKTADSFLKKLQFKEQAKAIIGGSYAKDTYLSGNKEVDLFIAFDFKKYSSQSEQLSEILKKELRRLFPKQKLEQLHGSRDYFQIEYQNVTFEIIPILGIKRSEEALNITDISPLHSEWVNKQTKKLKDDIRLAKQFCKANGLYGAESYIGGYSGYVLEILVGHYGSFENLLKASQKWDFKEVIDPENHYPKKDVFFQLNQSKLVSPIIVIDPVDKDRNASAALSMEKFLEFKRLAKEYLQKPSPELFKKKPKDLNSLKKEADLNHANLVFMTLVPLEGKIDVVGSQMVKAYEFLKEKLIPFSIKKSGWEWELSDETIFYYLALKKELPKFELKYGPPVQFKEHVKAFRKKYKDAYEDSDRMAIRVPAKNPRLEDFLAEILNDEYFKEKVRKVKVVKVV